MLTGNSVPGTALTEGVYDVRAAVAIALLMPMRHISATSSATGVERWSDPEISIRHGTPLLLERTSVAAKTYKVTRN